MPVILRMLVLTIGLAAVAPGIAWGTEPAEDETIARGLDIDPEEIEGDFDERAHQMQQWLRQREYERLQQSPGITSDDDEEDDEPVDYRAYGGTRSRPAYADDDWAGFHDAGGNLRERIRGEYGRERVKAHRIEMERRARGGHLRNRHHGPSAHSRGTPSGKSSAGSPKRSVRKPVSAASHHAKPTGSRSSGRRHPRR